MTHRHPITARPSVAARRSPSPASLLAAVAACGDDDERRPRPTAASDHRRAAPTTDRRDRRRRRRRPRRRRRRPSRPRPPRRSMPSDAAHRRAGGRPRPTRRPRRRWSSRSTTSRRPPADRAQPSPTSCSRRSSRAALTRFAAVFHSPERRPGRPDPLRPHPGRRPARRRCNAPLFVWSGGNAGVNAGDRRRPTLVDRRARVTPTGYYRVAAAAARRTTCTTAPTRSVRAGPAGAPGAPPQQFDVPAPGRDRSPASRRRRRRRPIGSASQVRLGLGRRHRHVPAARQNGDPHDDRRRRPDRRRTTSSCWRRVPAEPGRRQQPRGADRRHRPGVRVHRRQGRCRHVDARRSRIDPFTLHRRRRHADRARRRAARGSSWPTNVAHAPTPATTGVDLVDQTGCLIDR